MAEKRMAEGIPIAPDAGVSHLFWRGSVVELAMPFLIVRVVLFPQHLALHIVGICEILVRVGKEIDQRFVVLL